jgi:uncharacterized membrane protein
MKILKFLKRVRWANITLIVGYVWYSLWMITAYPNILMTLFCAALGVGVSVFMDNFMAGPKRPDKTPKMDERMETIKRMETTLAELKAEAKKLGL